MRCSRKAKMLLTRYGHASEDFVWSRTDNLGVVREEDARLLKARAQIENYIATLEAALANATKDPNP